MYVAKVRSRRWCGAMEVWAVGCPVTHQCCRDPRQNWLETSQEFCVGQVPNKTQELRQTYLLARESCDADMEDNPWLCTEQTLHMNARVTGFTVPPGGTEAAMAVSKAVA